MRHGFRSTRWRGIRPRPARLATRLYKFFVNETTRAGSEALISSMMWRYSVEQLQHQSDAAAAVRLSQFRNPNNFFQRYSWPVEFVVRAIKETGWTGYSVNTAITPLANMGQNLYEPPDVNGWDARPRVDLDLVDADAHELRGGARAEPALQPRARRAAASRQSRPRARIHAVAVPEHRLQRRRHDAAMVDYLRSGVTAWTGSDAQLQQKVRGSRA